MKKKCRHEVLVYIGEESELECMCLECGKIDDFFYNIVNINNTVFVDGVNKIDYVKAFDVRNIYLQLKHHNLSSEDLIYHVQEICNDNKKKEKIKVRL